MRQRSFSLRALPLVVVALSVIAPAGASGAAGELDPSWGNGGVARESFGLMGDLIEGLALQPNGSVVAGGTVYNGASGEYGLGVARFTPSGQLDGSFGGGGVSRLNVAGQNLFASSMIQQGDGKFVVGGTGSTQVYLAQFGANGGVDPTYGGGFGYLTRDWGGSNGLFSLSLLPSGATLAAGGALGGIAMGSYTSAGNNNNIFNPGATPAKVVQFTTDDDTAFASAALPDGRFVLAGRVDMQPGESKFAVARFLADGMPDPTFGGGTGVTVVTSPVDDFGQIQSIALAPDNTVYAAGFAGEAGSRDSVVLKVLPAGPPDPSFGENGILNIGVAGEDAANAIALTPDGKLAVAGTAGGVTAGDIVVSRVLTSGALDSSFGAGGRTVTNLGGNDKGSAVAVRPDLDILVGGSSAPSIQTDDFVILEYQGSTSPMPLIPVSRITSPSRASLKRKKFHRFAGTAGPAGLVSRVEIAVRRINKQQLRKKRCLWLSSPRAKFKKVRATARKKCAKQHWIRAKGTTKWSYALKKTLPPGRYEIFARATLTDGQTQTTFTATAGNFKKLKLVNK